MHCVWIPGPRMLAQKFTNLYQYHITGNTIIQAVPYILQKWRLGIGSKFHNVFVVVVFFPPNLNLLSTAKQGSVCPSVWMFVGLYFHILSNFTLCTGAERASSA